MSSNHKTQQIPNWIHAISGSTGGMLAMLLTYPLITISTQAQTEAKKQAQSQPTKDQPSTKDAKKQLTIENLKKNVKFFLANKQEILKLYSGLESALIGIGLTNFVYYYFYELCKKIITLRNLKKRQSNLSTLQSMLLSTIAGCITVILTNPVWVANTRLTVRPLEHKDLNTFQIILKILKQPQGLKQLFNGVLPLLVLVGNPILQYTFFEQSKNLILKKKPRLSPFDAFYLGAIGKLIATGVTYPYITLKLRMHLQKLQKSMAQLTKEIYQGEGLSGFYNGISVKLTQSILTAAFLFFFKEQLVSVNFQVYKSILSLKNAKR